MKRRVLRGGSAYYVNRVQRATSHRNWYVPENRRRYCGFRVVIRRKP